MIFLLVFSGTAKAAENIASGKSATQSSNYNSVGVASKAVDGNIAGQWAQKSVSHTGYNNNPWWQVDLGASYYIDQIKIYNRTDCCTKRLSNFYVLVSDTPFASNDLNQLLNDGTVWKTHHAGDARSTQATLFEIAHSARYVRVQLAYSGFLHMAEVEVFGSSDSSAGNLGVGEIVSANHSGKCIDVAGASNAENARVVQYTCSNVSHEKFSFKSVGDTYQIVAQHSGKCLGVRSGATNPGATVVQMSCAMADHQKWQITGSGDNRQIKVKHTGMCLNVNGGSKNNDALLIQWPCVNSANEKWRLPDTGGTSTTEELGVGEIVSAKFSGKCVDVAGASNAENARVVQYTCSNVRHEQFAFNSTGDSYQIVAQHSGKCLGVRGGSTSAGAHVAQMNCDLVDHQKWQVTGTGDNRQIKAKHTGMCLNVNGGSKANDALLIQWPCGYSANDKWRVPLAGSLSASGSWAGPYSIPLVGAAAANLPDGRVLTWSAYSKVTFGGARGSTYTAIFDPATGQSTEALISNTNHDMFCPGISQLSDGSIMVTGGSNAGATSIYSPASNQWSKGPDLNTTRGYHSQTTTGDGSVFTVGGSWSGGRFYKDGELWNPNTNRWTAKPSAFSPSLLTDDSGDIFRSDNHMWLHTAPNGLVFHAGPSKSMHYIDPANQGAVYYEKERGAADAMNGNAVMYDIGKLLTVGGAPDYDNSAASKQAYTVDINGGRGNTVVQRVSDLHLARSFHNSVVLPSGEVVVVGGQKIAKAFSDDESALDAEIWNPNTGEFSLLAPMRIPRNYHSFALLLQDARVIAGGSGLCGGCATNHPDVEILSPPYLYNKDGSLATRPTIDNVPSRASYGDRITVVVNTAAMHQFTLVRTGSATHSVNTDQRRIPLTAQSIGGGQFSVSIPANPAVVVPGNYFLFALNNNGVPSVARVINIQ